LDPGRGRYGEWRLALNIPTILIYEKEKGRKDAAGKGGIPGKTRFPTVDIWSEGGLSKILPIVARGSAQRVLSLSLGLTRVKLRVGTASVLKSRTVAGVGGHSGKTKRRRGPHKKQVGLR